MPSPANPPPGDASVTLFLCGDVMTGRGIDQILPRPCDPTLHEPYIKDARRYCELAEKAHGPIPRSVTDEYVWGDALAEWQELRPDVRIANLETSVTTSDRYWKGKEIHYRMSPANLSCLRAARFDCCALANNHVLDWGYEGLTETLESLERAGIKTAGAGRNRTDAEAPAIVKVSPRCRVLVFSLGSETSGIPSAWGAGGDRAGVNFLVDLSIAAAEHVGDTINRYRQAGDVVVISLHWGGNWGYNVPSAQRAFAHGLIERAGADVIHGHSSHHAKGIEVYQDKLILYGCGDFLTDYEGIAGYEAFRGDLAVMYFAHLEAASGKLVELRLVPLQNHRLRLRHAQGDDIAWLECVLNRKGESLNAVNRFSFRR